MTKPTRWDWDEWHEATMALRRRCGDRCEKCGDDLHGQVERHHRQRRRAGGDALSNLLMLCTRCHTYVHTHPAEARDHGWIVSAYAEPLDTPVLIAGRRWLLTDEGTRAMVT